MDIITLSYSILLIAIAFVGVISNLAVIIAITINRNLRTPTNFLILNLSCADFLECLVAMPARIVPSLQSRSSMRIPCHVTLCLSMIFGGASRMNTVLIAIDRFVAIKWPFWYKEKVNDRFLLIVVFITWLVVVGVSIVPSLGVGLKEDQSNSTMCYYFNTLSIPFLYVFILTFSIAPLVIVIPINCFLVRASFRHMQSIHSQRINIGVINPACEQTFSIQNHSTAVQNEVQNTWQTSYCSGGVNLQNISKSNQSSTTSTLQNGVKQTTNKRTGHNTRSTMRSLMLQSKVARMIALLIFTFIIFVAPISIIDLIQVANKEVYIPELLSKIAIAMIYLNTSANVLIYAGYNKEFRKSFLRMFAVERIRSFVSSFGDASRRSGRAGNGSVNANSNINSRGHGKVNEVQLLSFKNISES